MYAQDFDRFRKVMDTLAELFSKPKMSDDAMGAYWEALKDLHIAVVEREAKHHGRYAKFFPKPVELRPKTEKPPEPQDEKALGDCLSDSERNWEKLRAENPEQFWHQFAKAYVARLSCRFKPDSHEFRDARDRCLSRCNEELAKLGGSKVHRDEIMAGALYADPSRTRSTQKAPNVGSGDEWVF